jgi:hypothetical protein
MVSCQPQAAIVVRTGQAVGTFLANQSRGHHLPCYMPTATVKFTWLHTAHSVNQMPTNSLLQHQCAVEVTVTVSHTGTAKQRHSMVVHCQQKQQPRFRELTS